MLHIWGQLAHLGEQCDQRIFHRQQHVHNDRHVYQLALVLMPPALIDEVWQDAWVRVGSERQIQISGRLVMTRSD